MVKDVVLAFYTACSVFLMVYSVTQAVLLCRLGWAMLRRRVADVPPQPDFWPPVLVQLPIYNEKYVVARLLEAVAAFDYPRHQLTIQVLDDSTDDTAEVVASLVSQYRRRGLPIQHIRRPDRAGFKAGALAYGLDRAPHAEYVVIFDADFTPAPDVLRRLLPYFATHERVGFVQGRWGHLNAGDTWLTRAQALNIDAYYAVEQAARSSLGTVMSFNGTGGMWRVEAIRAAGG